ncbi:MAG: hypothetical protein A2201_08280 [Alicyclobacillus sp. RIFOXYA1_FULL_53_8]|nr:MAG: hypothetical protein A2201_08280 [Alicyclobacillus sp. RIFOXYA1_FULL_53_8]
MELDDFLDELHFAPHKNNSSDWHVNWDDAPLPFKLYRRLPTFELSHEVPLTIPRPDANLAAPELSDIGHFLWYTFGLSQRSYFVEVGDVPDEEIKVSTASRRFVPSGGGLYPSELYVYLKMEPLPVGVYHYDVAHHRLVLLRKGNVDEYLEKAKLSDSDLSTSFATVIVSTFFWKNFFKYHNFSYRLQGLDAGVLLGQLRAVAARFGFAAEVCFQFLDRALNHLLGLNEQEESVYAVIPLRLASDDAHDTPRSRAERTQSATELCELLPEIQVEYYIGSRSATEYPMLLRLNEASFLESADAAVTSDSRLSLTPKLTSTPDAIASSSSRAVDDPGQTQGGQTLGLPTVALPPAGRLSYDFLSVCQRRLSPGLTYVHSSMNLGQLASLLYETTTAAFRGDELYGTDRENAAAVSIYVSLHGIDGIADGAYRYDAARQQLKLIRLGDQREALQFAMNMGTVSLFHVPICIHLAGHRDFNKSTLGYRGHRIEHMRTGMILQCLLLSASALGMNGHPLLDFNAGTCDAIYDLESSGETTLVQVPIGFHGAGIRFTGGLHG